MTRLSAMKRAATSLLVILGLMTTAQAPARVLVPGFVDAVQKISDSAG